MPQTPPYQTNYSALSINPEYFKEDFNVDAFLVTLTKGVIEPTVKQDARAPSDEAAAKATIERVQQLQKRFARAEDEIALLSHEVAAQLLDLQHGTSQDEQNSKVCTQHRAPCCNKRALGNILRHTSRFCARKHRPGSQHISALHSTTVASSMAPTLEQLWQQQQCSCKHGFTLAHVSTGFLDIRTYEPGGSVSFVSATVTHLCI